MKLDPDFNYTHPSEVSQIVNVGSNLHLIAIVTDPWRKALAVLHLLHPCSFSSQTPSPESEGLAEPPFPIHQWSGQLRSAFEVGRSKGQNLLLKITILLE